MGRQKTKYWKRAIFTLDVKTIKELNELSQITGQSKTKIIELAVYEYYKKVVKDEATKG